MGKRRNVGPRATRDTRALYFRRSASNRHSHLTRKVEDNWMELNLRDSRDGRLASVQEELRDDGAGTVIKSGRVDL